MTLHALLLAPVLLASGSETTRPAVATPRVAETRLFRIRQTVALHDVPADAKEVRLWVPVPADGAWQRVMDRKVVEAPEGWRMEFQPGSDAEMVFATTPARETVQVVVETTVARQSPVFDMTPCGGEIQTQLFDAELTSDAPLMSVDDGILALAREAVGTETDPRRKAVLLLNAVADAADHYSKDPTKPSCGRGSAEDCMTNGGGCCTDLHSLFIAAARTQGIPARMQYGYRLNPAKEGTEYDPSYRCWVEFYLPNAGWVPTDLVVADSGAPAERMSHYGMLDARRVWLWRGRDLELTPHQNGAAIQTMSCGWAEIDGQPVDVLPGQDGSPSRLRRTILFAELTGS